ncbi:hypothetical protein GB937_010385 [Aspergillus fischeri]|nr:hypothetical protein GB937_010385 [Aspergillus fischeri]
MGHEAPPPEDTATDGEDRETPKLLAELAKLRREIRKRDELHRDELQKVKAEFRAALAEVRQELEDLRSGAAFPHHNSESCSQTSHEEILQELQSLRSAITTPNTTSDHATWAQVAAAGDKTQPTPRNPVLNKKKQPKEVNCIRVSTKPSDTGGENDNENTFGRYLPPRLAVTHIQNALSITHQKTYRSWEWEPPEPEWLEELGNNTKLARPRFAVVAHRTPTEDFLSPENEKAFIDKIMEENEMEQHGFRISRIAWLKPRDKPIGKHGSLALWFDTREAAEWAIDNGLLMGQRYIGSREDATGARDLATLLGHVEKRPGVDIAQASTNYDAARLA